MYSTPNHYHLVTLNLTSEVKIPSTTIHSEMRVIWGLAKVGCACMHSIRIRFHGAPHVRTEYWEELPKCAIVPALRYRFSSVCMGSGLSALVSSVCHKSRS